MADKLEIKYQQAHITPFWRKLPFFFRFPFRTSPLIFIACIVAAGVLAGLLLGPFGLLFKGILVYFGLRYGFNVLELFARGRFEGESVDHTLWGPEKRPAKLGLVILLYVVVGLLLGEAVVGSRLAKDPRAQQQIIDRYKAEHAAEMAQREREREALNKRIGLDSAPAQGTGQGNDADHDDPPDSPPPVAAAPVPAADAERAAYGLSRAEILQSYKPGPSDPLWFRLLPAWYWLVMLLLSLLLPAATIVIALDDEFFKSLNPVYVLQFIRTMGGAYFVLWAFFLLIVGARQLVLSVGEQWLPVVRFPIEFGLATYLALVLCAMLGYVLYQYHQELHLDVDVDFDTHRQAGGAEAIARAGSARVAVNTAHPQDGLERKVQVLVAQGHFKEAIAEVKDEMRYDRLDADLNTRLHALYLKQGDRAETLVHGQQWLTALVRDGQGKHALAALRTMLRLSPDFAVQDSNVLLPTAQAAMQDGDRELAVSLLRGFDKRFPEHKDLPGVYFLVARLMSEHGRQHEKAAQLLRNWLTKYTGHASAGEVRTYLAVLERMLAKP
jgi:tetratricopeptide (TPR) repeat protein